MSPVILAAGGTGSGIVDWAMHVMDLMGAPGVGALIALENLFPPIPSEAVLPLAGLAAARGAFGVVSAVVWATLGSLVGALALYGVGAALGRDRMIRVIDRMPLVDVSSMLHAEEVFRRHGRGAVFFGRLVPGVRSLVSIPAGLSRMPLLQFCALTTLGSALWNGVLIGAGVVLGDRWHVVEQYVGIIQYVVVAVVTAWAIRAVVRRVRDSRDAEQDRSPAA